MRGSQGVLAVLLGLVGGVAALTACGEDLGPPLGTSAGAPVEALCGDGAWRGGYVSQTACEQELSELRLELATEQAPEQIYAWTLEAWQYAPEPRSGVGGPCRAPHWRAKVLRSDCQGGLFCDASFDDPGTCKAWREPGSACRTSHECSPDRFCAYARPRDHVWGRCERKPGLGEDCTLDIFRTCAPGLRCAAESGRCVP